MLMLVPKPTPMLQSIVYVLTYDLYSKEELMYPSLSVVVAPLVPSPSDCWAVHYWSGGSNQRAH